MDVLTGFASDAEDKRVEILDEYNSFEKELAYEDINELEVAERLDALSGVSQLVLEETVPFDFIIFYRAEVGGVVFEGSGRFGDGILLRVGAGEAYTIDVTIPEASIIGTASGVGGASGTGFEFDILFRNDDGPDTDQDGLTDFSERVIGTIAASPDTDNDGILDGAEIEQGLNPLDGLGFPTGIIAGVTLKGEALDVTVAGSLTARPPTHYGAAKCGWMRVELKRGSYHRACHSA